jgi:ankyrin repeat protein
VTVLLAVVGTNDQPLVEMLIRSGANVNFPAKGSVKRTPLQRAAELGFHEMVEFLIHLHADVNAAPAHSKGGTALQLAAREGKLKTISSLLSHEADVDVPTSNIA